jgi:hypothetical protein
MLRTRLRETLAPTAEKIVFAVLVAAYVAPFWTFRYIPTEDGPPHLANANIIRHYDDAGAYRIREYYTVNVRVPTNVGYHYALAALLYVFPPYPAQRVLLSFIVIFFAVAFRRLVATVAGRPEPAAWLVLPFIVGQPFQMGFFGSTLSLALAAATLAYYWRRRDALGPGQVVVLNAAAALAFWVHLLGWAVLVAGTAYLAYVETLWVTASRGPRPARSWYARRLAVPFFLAPALALGLGYYFTQPHLGTVIHQTPQWLWEKFSRCSVLISFNDFQRWAAFATARLLGLTALLIVIAKSWPWRRRPGVTPAWRLTDALGGGAAAAAAAAYALAPESTPFQGSWINIRLLLVMYVAVVAFVAGARVGWLRRAMYVVAPAVALVHLAGIIAGYTDGSRRVREFLRAKMVIQAGATILPVVNQTPPRGSRVNYMKHAAAYFTLGTNAVDLTNYEARYVYFPVRWRAGHLPINLIKIKRSTPVYDVLGKAPVVDYVLLYGIEKQLGPLSTFLTDYDLIFFHGETSVYRRRPPS